MTRTRSSGLLLLMLLLVCQAAGAQGWLVAPARQELTLRPGESETFVVRLEREQAKTSAGPVRFSVSPSDWDVTREGEVVLAPPQSSLESANGWVLFSPASFVLPAGGMQQIRVTVTVPLEMLPGVYRAGLFFEEQSTIPPQAEQTKRVVFRYRLSTLIYVMVPPLDKKVAVRDVEAKENSNGTVTIRALLANSGTMHLRPQQWVEVRDERGDTLLKTEPKPTMVLLPGHELVVELPLPQPLPRRVSYQIRYLVDAAPGLPLQSTILTLVGRE